MEHFETGCFTPVINTSPLLTWSITKLLHESYNQLTFILVDR